MTRKAAQHRESRRLLFAAAGFLVLVLALAAAWHLTALHEYADPGALARRLKAVAKTPWMPLVVGVVWVLASLVMFPNTVLCFAIIMALGPVLGAIYAYGGSLAAAVTGYAIGRRGGKRVDRLHVGAFKRASDELRSGGFVRLLALRLLPVVPFSATNILSGAARVRLVPFMVATLVGISPYVLTFAVFGRQARRLLAHPEPVDIAITAAIAVTASLALWQAHALAARRAR